MRRKKPADPRPLEKSTAERLGEIVEAAERAAAAVIDDAETEARRYLSEARLEADRLVAERLAALREQTDSLIDQADSIRRQADSLLGSLEQARELLEGEPAPARASRGSHLSAVAPVAEPRLREDRAPVFEVPGAVERPEERRGGNAAGARLLATQMAVSGASREEIEKTLRGGFEIDDTDAILDAILGPEG